MSEVTLIYLLKVVPLVLTWLTFISSKWKYSWNILPKNRFLENYSCNVTLYIQMPTSNGFRLRYKWYSSNHFAKSTWVSNKTRVGTRLHAYSPAWSRHHSIICWDYHFGRKCLLWPSSWPAIRHARTRYCSKQQHNRSRFRPQAFVNLFQTVL